jgi:hypothetical protein
MKEIFFTLKKGVGSGVGSGSGSISQRYGSPDPDPHRNARDPQHWLDFIFIKLFVEIICCLFQLHKDQKLHGSSHTKGNL